MVEPLDTKALTAADLVEMIAHKEQIGIWANEIATAISLGDMLKEDWSFDDSVDLEREIVAQLRDILSSAFSHPAYDIASRVQSLEKELKSSNRNRDAARQNFATIQVAAAALKAEVDRLRGLIEAHGSAKLIRNALKVNGNG